LYHFLSSFLNNINNIKKIKIEKSPINEAIGPKNMLSKSTVIKIIDIKIKLIINDFFLDGNITFLQSYYDYIIKMVVISINNYYQISKRIYN
jgi:hypothetical protein